MTKIDAASEGDLKKEQQHPGASVSVNHVELGIKGIMFSSF